MQTRLKLWFVVSSAQTALTKHRRARCLTNRKAWPSHPGTRSLGQEADLSAGLWAATVPGQQPPRIEAQGHGFLLLSVLCEDTASNTLKSHTSQSQHPNLGKTVQSWYTHVHILSNKPEYEASFPVVACTVCSFLDLEEFFMRSA